MELTEMMDPVESDRFVIDSDAKADWALRKIREQREDVARWRSYYLAQIAKAEESAQQTEAFFMALLERHRRPPFPRDTQRSTTANYLFNGDTA